MVSDNDDPYAIAARGKLRLKGDSGIKKKHKKKDKKKLEQSVTQTVENVSSNSITPAQPSLRTLTKTKAELAFLKQTERMQAQRIMEKASLTHKERVEKFNQHLDNLTEHFDIPKVSWTK